MKTKSKTTKSSKSKKVQVEARDLKPKKDAKGGYIGTANGGVWKAK